MEQDLKRRRVMQEEQEEKCIELMDAVITKTRLAKEKSAAKNRWP